MALGASIGGSASLKGQRTEPCSVHGCTRLSVASLDIRVLCREHFIMACYNDLDEYGRLLEESRYRDTTTELVRRFLSDCTRQTADLSSAASDLDNLERARLLDILLRASDLSRQLRRSPRKVATLPVGLTCDKLGHSWEELTETRVISRFGAALECGNPIELGDSLILTRLDSKAEVRARVAWRQPKPGGRCEIGLEFLHTDNFWGIDWSAVEPDFWESTTSKRAAS